MIFLKVALRQAQGPGLSTAQGPKSYQCESGAAGTTSVIQCYNQAPQENR